MLLPKDVSSTEGQTDVDALYFVTMDKGHRLRSVLHAYKTGNIKDVDVCFLQFFEVFLEKLVLDDFSLLVVPSHRAHLRRRGFSPMDRIARKLASQIGIPLCSSLTLAKEYHSQKELTAQQRRQNIKGAFQCDDHLPKKVLLIDDVYTTGSTISEVSHVLKEGGVEELVVVCLIRAD